MFGLFTASKDAFQQAPVAQSLSIDAIETTSSADYDSGKFMLESSTEAGEYDPLANTELIRLRAENKMLTATNQLGENLALATENKDRIKSTLMEQTSKFKGLLKDTVEARDAEVLTNRTCLNIIEELKQESLLGAELNAKDKVLLEQRITVLTVELNKKNELIESYSNEVRSTVASKTSAIASLLEAHSKQKESHANELKQVQVQVDLLSRRNELLQSEIDSELKLTAPMKNLIAELEAKDKDAQIAIDKLRKDLLATRQTLQKSQNDGKAQREQINSLKLALTATQQENTVLNMQNTELKDKNEELSSERVAAADNIYNIQNRMRSIFEKVYTVSPLLDDKAAIFSMSSTMSLDGIMAKIESELPVMISDLDGKVTAQYASINDLNAAISAKEKLLQQLECEAKDASAKVASLERDVGALTLKVTDLTAQVTITNNYTNIDPLLTLKMEKLQQSLLDAQQLSKDLSLSVHESGKSTTTTTTTEVISMSNITTTML